MLHIITGPLNAGKSTFKRSLCEKTGSPIVAEYPFGIDVTAPKWWKELEAFAKEHSTEVVETHLDFGDFDSDSKASLIVLSEIKVPTKAVRLYFVLPSLDTLHRRQQAIDKYASLLTAKNDIEWYRTMLKAFKNVTILS